MTRSTVAVRLLLRSHLPIRLTSHRHAARLHPSTLIHHPCQYCPSSACSRLTIFRSFSTTPPPPPPPPIDGASPSSTARHNESALAATAQLVSSSSPSPAPPADTAVIYTSPFVSAVRRMKLFSLSSCALSLASAPLLLLLSSPSIPLSGRLAMCTAVAAFGIGTTLALTRFTQPYAIRIYQPTADTLTVETLNVWARPRYRTVRVDGLRPLYNRLFSNVRALHNSPAERPYSDYFLHADIVDHPLLKPLVQHSLPPPEEQSDVTQQEKMVSAEQIASTQQSTTAGATKQQ